MNAREKKKVILSVLRKSIKRQKEIEKEYGKRQLNKLGT